MSSVQQNEMQMLNEYVVALQRQIKSNEGERQILIKEVARLEQNNNKAEIQSRQVKNQLKELNSVLSRQNIEKVNIENQVNILSGQNEKQKKESELKEQKIKQLNNSITQKTDLLAKQKNNFFLTNSYHSKQMGAIQEKLKEVQKKLKQSIQEKNLLSCSLISCNQQLATQKQQNDKGRSKIGFCERYIKTLESKAKLLQKEAIQTSDDKDSISSSLQKITDQLSKAKLEIQKLSLQLISGNQNSEESKRSYQTFINGLKSNYEQEITQLKGQILQHKYSINQKKQSIERINTRLDLQKVNYEKELQKSFQFAEQVSKFQKELERTKREMTLEIQSKEFIILSMEKQNNQLMERQFEAQQQIQRTLALKFSTEEELKSRLNEYQIKYDQDIIEKDEHIDSLNSKLTAKFIEIQELKYDLSEAQKRQENLNHQLKKREQQLNNLNTNLERNKEKIKQLSNQITETYKKLQNRTKEYNDKERESQALSQKQALMLVAIENLKKEVQLLTKLKEEKNSENKRLKGKVEGLTEQLSEAKNIQAKLNKNLQENEQKLSKTVYNFTIFKEGSEKKLLQTLKRLNDVERQLEKLKLNYKEKQETLKRVIQEYGFKTKDFAAKQQQMSKKLIEMESKNDRVNINLNEQQKQMEKRQQDLNQAVEILVLQHSNEIQDLRKKQEKQNKELQAKYFEQEAALSTQLQVKLIQVKELQEQLSRHQKSSAQLSSNQSTMKKTISMLQKQLEESHQQINSYHKKIFTFNNSTDKTRELLIEKEIKIISLTALLEKVREDNQRLMNEQSLLREQVTALESSTTYLKRQLTSTLDRQQNSLKEIGTLKQTNKSYSKLISSSSSSNINAIGERMNWSRNVERQKSFVSISAEIRRFESVKDFIPQAIEENKVEIFSPKKKENNFIHKDSKQESSTSVDSLRMEAEDKNTIFCKESLENQEFIQSTVNISESAVLNK